MPRKPIKPEPWWADAAALMVKYDLSLRQAAQQLGVELTIEEAEAIKDRKLFKECLEEARMAHFTEIGSSPKLSKDLVVGQVYKLASKLADEGETYKASDALLKLSKIRGWVGYEPDSLYKTFSVLSAKEIDEVKQRLLELKQQEQPEPADKPQEPGSGSGKLVN